MKDEMSKPLNKNLELIKKMPKETQSASKQFLLMKKQVVNDLDTMKSKSLSFVKTGLKGIAIGGVAALTGLTLAVKDSLKYADEQIKAETRLNQLMMNVKGTTLANVSAVKKYAGVLQKTTTVGDEVTIAGASQLATFKLSADSIQTLLPALQDLAVGTYGVNVSQEQMIQSGNLIGKVMGGQVGALSRVGVTFDKTQEKMLKTGTQAQKTATLVEVLGQNYGGLAKEMAKTPQGKIIQLKNSFGDIKETIGKSVYPMVVQFSDYLMSKMPEIEKTIKNTITNAQNKLQQWASDGTLENIKAGFTAVASIVTEVGSKSMNVLNNALVWVKDNMSTVSFAVKLFISLLIVNKVLSFANGLMQSAKVAVTLVRGFKALSLAKMRENIATAKGTVLKIKDNAVTIAKNSVMIISKTATLLMAGAQWVLNSALLACPITWIVVGIGALIGVGVLLYKNWDTIKAKAFEVWEGIKIAFAPIVSFFGGMFESVTSGFKAFLNFFIKGINWVTDKINKISVDVPEWVPGLGGQKFGFDIPKIPEFALGTQYHKGGLARINERGGEIVNLPNGSKVIPHSLSKAGGGQTVVQNITIYADGKSIDEMVDEFVIRVKRGLANA